MGLLNKMKILLNGAAGKMGTVVEDFVKSQKDCQIIAGVDINKKESDYPIYKSFDEVNEKADVIIDFSVPAAFDKMLEYAVRTHTAAVVATTGLSESQTEALKKASESTPVFFTANMSIGVNLISALAKQAAKLLYGSFDIEIIEAHHRRKLDAPSGTALMLANNISEGLENKQNFIFDRSLRRESRPENEIGISAIRGGTIVGEHEVIFAGEDEIIKISHSARSRALFANGAVNGARFIKDKENGLYDMNDLLRG